MSAKGGITEGKSHKEGGIPMVVKSTGQQVELEGGEGVINKRNMASTKTFEFEGKEKTICEIASEINSADGNGVQIDCDNVTGTKYKYNKGGKILNEEQEQSFKEWMEDGNVHKFEDGYSTQDAQWSNRLKGLDELRRYFRKEFLSDSYAKGGWLLINADTERIIKEYDTESEARQMSYEYDGDSFVMEKSELEKEKLRETYRPPAPLNPATYIGMERGGSIDLEKYEYNQLIGKYVNIYSMGVELPSEHRIEGVMFSSPQFRYRQLTLKFDRGIAPIEIEDIPKFLNNDIVDVNDNKEDFGVQLIPNQFAKGGKTENNMKFEDYESASMSMGGYEDGAISSNPTEFANGGDIKKIKYGNMKNHKYAQGGGVDNVVWEKGFVEPDEDSDDRRYAKYETEIGNLDIFISEWSHRNWNILIQDKRDYNYLKLENFEGDLEGAKDYAISLSKELKSKGFAKGGGVNRIRYRRGWKAGTSTKFKTKKEALESLELLKYHNEGKTDFRVLGLKKIEGDKLNEGWVVEYEYKIKFAEGGGVDGKDYRKLILKKFINKVGNNKDQFVTKYGSLNGDYENLRLSVNVNEITDRQKIDLKQWAEEVSEKEFLDQSNNGEYLDFDGLLDLSKESIISLNQILNREFNKNDYYFSYVLLPRGYDFYVEGISYESGGGVDNQKVFEAKEDGILGIYSGSDAYTIEISKGDIFATFGKQDDGNWWFVKKINVKPISLMLENTFDYNQSKSNVPLEIWQDLVLTFPKGENSIYAEMKEVFADGGDVRNFSWYQDFKKQELKRGTEHEMEHIESIKKFKKKGVSDREVAKAIAKDHLDENENYYIELEKMQESSEKVSNALKDFEHQKSKRKSSRKYKLGGYMGDNKSVNVHIKLTKDHEAVVRSKDGTYLNDVNLKKDKVYKFGFLFDEGQNVAFDLGDGSDSYILVPSNLVVVVGYDEEKMELGGEVKSYADYNLDRNDKSILKLLLNINPRNATAEQRDKVSTFKGNNIVNDLSPKLIQKIYGVLFQNHNVDNKILNLYITNIGVGNIVMYAPSYLHKTMVGFDEKNQFVQVEKEIANIVTEGKRRFLFNEFELTDIDGFIHVYPKSNPEVDTLCDIFYKSKKKAVALGVCEFTSREKLDAFQRSIVINQGSMALNQMISFAKSNDYLIVNEGITSEGAYTLIYTMTKY